MYNAIPVLLIFASVVAAVAVVARRLPDIAAINTDSIAEARAAATKRRLMLGYLERRIREALAGLRRAAARVRVAAQVRGVAFYGRLTALERRYRTPRVPSAGSGTAILVPSAQPAPFTTPVPESIAALLAEAERDRAAQHYDEAERCYLAVIHKDHRHAEAYRGLGRLYQDKRHFEEARQAFAHALRLQPDAAGHAALGALYSEEQRLAEALVEYQKAVALDSTPEYLDRLLEVCILVGNKGAAKDALGQLRTSEPAYPRLTDLEQRVNDMSRRKRSSSGRS